MVAPLYVRARATATRLIERNGKPAQLVREERSGPPHAPVLTQVAHDCMVADIGYSITDRPGTHIEAGDKIGIMSPAVAVEPQKTDVLRIDGSDYRFVDLQPLNPGGLVVLYEYVARR